MKFFVDTADLAEIRDLASTGLLILTSDTQLATKSLFLFICSSENQRPLIAALTGRPFVRFSTRNSPLFPAQTRS